MESFQAHYKLITWEKRWNRWNVVLRNVVVNITSSESNENPWVVESIERPQASMPYHEYSKQSD